MKPDPKCPQCHGTGRIELFTSVIACECLFFKWNPRPSQVAPLELPTDDDWWQAFNDHGNGD